MALAGAPGANGGFAAERLEVLAWNEDGTAAVLALPGAAGDLAVTVAQGSTGIFLPPLRLLDPARGGEVLPAASCEDSLDELQGLLASLSFEARPDPAFCGEARRRLLLDPEGRPLPPSASFARTGDEEQPISAGGRSFGCLTAGIAGDNASSYRNRVRCAGRTLLERPARTMENWVTTEHFAPKNARAMLVIVAEPGLPAYLYPALFSEDGSFTSLSVVPWKEGRPGGAPLRLDLDLAQLSAALGALLLLASAWLRFGGGWLRRRAGGGAGG